ncbi:hypothetical protein CPter291_1889 [Collimonas pratensis]|uniref:Uncharacterized protein n=1 Tax=Collimonas pratensis TaxID=279113 RepID=A0ABN4M992_9BURK|nr:hypothetical protein CPter291_1889 [Collimonas pratensis]
MRKIAQCFYANVARSGAHVSNAPDVKRSPKIDVRMSNIVRKCLNGISCFSFHPLLFHPISQLPLAV